jgi:hypothetical protein
MKRYNLIAIVFLISLLSSGTRLSALRHGNYRGGAETNVNRNANVHQHVNVNRNVNVNVNNNYHGGGCYNNSCCNHPVAAAAAVTATAVGTAAVVGSIVSLSSAFVLIGDRQRAGISTVWKHVVPTAVLRNNDSVDRGKPAELMCSAHINSTFRRHSASKRREEQIWFS